MHPAMRLDRLAHMVRRRFPVLVSNVFVMATLAVAVPFKASAAASDESQQASEIFEGAMRALAENRAEVARKAFETVILEYPGSLQADQAARELAHMNGTSQPDVAGGGRPDTESAVSGARNVLAPSPDEAGADADADAETPPRTLESLRFEFLTTTGDRVFFPANSAAIGTRAHAVLANQVRWLQRQPEAAIRIIGRADDGGNADQEQDLSLKRAMAVHDQLIALGLAETRLTFEARGDRDRVATCSGDICKIQNRQAETLLIERRELVGNRTQPSPALARGLPDDPAAGDTVAR